MNPCENNIGGRTQIFSHMKNHQLTLLSVKPTISSKDRPFSAQTHNIKKKNLHEYGEVFESFKRVANLKRNKISDCPKTFGILGKFKKTDKKTKYNFQEMQHEIILKNQKRRIEELGSLKERKKNSMDPAANPVFFFRTNEDKQNININDFCKKLGFTQNDNFEGKNRTINNLKYNYEKEENVEKIFNITGKNRMFQKMKVDKENLEKFRTTTKTDIHKNDKTDFHKKSPEELYRLYKSSLNPVDRKDEGGVKKNYHLQKKLEEEDKDFVLAPTVNGNSDEDYKKLKRLLINAIVNNRLYKENDLIDLKERTILLNDKLDANKVEEIFDLIYEELEA